MKIKLPPVFFITGTDTEIGKTVVSAILTIGLGGGYWKPIRTGAPFTDTDWIKQHTKLDDTHFFKEAYLFAPHISPHEAAALEGVTINLNNLQLPDYKHLPHLIVEGAGGVMVPVNETQTLLDVILHLNLQTIVVARSGLGTINHTTLTVDKLRQHSIPVLGVVMNGPKHPSNRQAIEHYAQIPVLAEVEPLEVITPSTLKAAFHKYFEDNNDSNFQTNKFSSLASVHPS